MVVVNEREEGLEGRGRGGRIYEKTHLGKEKN